MTKSKSIAKRLIIGTLSGAYHWITKITLPTYIFTALIGVSIVGINLGYTETKVNEILYYITAFGLVSTVLSFFKASAPKRSIREPIADFFLLFVNICYLYTFRLSGALTFTNLVIPIDPSLTVYFSLDLINMIYVSMAVIGLKMVLAIVDIIKASFFPAPLKEKEQDDYWNQKKQKLKRKASDAESYQYSYDLKAEKEPDSGSDDSENLPYTF